jgi:hypothetical protein
MDGKKEWVPPLPDIGVVWKIPGNVSAELVQHSVEKLHNVWKSMRKKMKHL